MEPNTLTRVLRLDAAANALAGAGLVVAGGLLAGPLGLSTALPVRLLGLALFVYGVENLLVARRTTPAGLVSLIVVDLVFAVGAVAVAATDPLSAEMWARWALVGVAGLSGGFGFAKLAGLRSRAGRAVRHAA